MSGLPQTSASATSLLLEEEVQSGYRGNVQFSLPPSPQSWGLPLDINTKEQDDYLHNPDPLRDRKVDKGGNIFTSRGIANLGCLFILCAGCLMLLWRRVFLGYPILSHLLTKPQTTQGGFNLGGTNATGQVPLFPTNFQLIDKDTPAAAYTKKPYTSQDEFVLVFSDEFNTDGRTFYPGDDPFWEAVDLHYWGTNDLEWYDPNQPITKGGALRLTIERVDPVNNHDLNYRSGMATFSRNKFCFTGGIVEAAVTLPGSNKVSGLWPAVWAMGNLGRAGFGGSLDGLWPYSYDSCDVGTLPNQTYPGTSTPVAATTNGDPSKDNVLSYLPGQRLSACTCPGESHPGPMRKDGSYVGRAAPEIDIFEALVDADGGKVSLSAQWAPYNARYQWKNTSDNLIIHDTQGTVLNTYVGGAYQQTTSGLALTNQDCYELGKQCFSVYGFEYKPGFDNGYITWINDGKPSWTIRGPGMGIDTLTEIGPRSVSFEPMYLIANLGFSMNFAQIDLDLLQFPATMSIDYIRVYQPKNAINIGCDPPNFPTAQYIETYKDVYTNPNISTWEHAQQPWPKNRLQNGGTC
ncbi:glycoside hydrolase family 16 protein [Hebeloma cylindrosporum]|uniref:Glycoside hydrolase family 16 protein n=1 Tax=Hebeloma cylindrosporum TaxID=76867 RepID=A0A0C3BZH2_HEBCY|nr:glycoside hydrolase family 16 protein [Hebeloma cylindrosporum h7]